MADLVGLVTLPVAVADLLAACMRSSELRLVFSGPTGSGKSTLVRACLAELDSLVRVEVIEDTAELDHFDPVTHPNVESWEGRLPKNEGKGTIGSGAQVKHALRYRPDWLVYGEVRDSDAALHACGDVRLGARRQRSPVPRPRDVRRPTIAIVHRPGRPSQVGADDAGGFATASLRDRRRPQALDPPSTPRRSVGPPRRRGPR